MNSVQAIVYIPVCSILGSKLDSAYKAKGICSSGINSLRLLNPVKSKLKTIVLLIILNLIKVEVIRHYLKLTIINLEIRIEVKYRSNLCQGAYTLCKLKQEVPCRCIFHICSGQHVNKVSKLRRNRNLGHIHCKDIGCNHILIGINYFVTDAVISCGVRNYAIPSKKSVTTGCLIKVKGVFALLVNVYGYTTAYIGIINKGCGNLYHLNSAVFFCSEVITVKSSGLVIVHCKYCIICIDCNLFTLIISRYGKSDS